MCGSNYVLYVFLNTGSYWSPLSRDASVALVWCSQYSKSDRVILLSVECPVICQMQQLSVSMETTDGPFSVFSSSLCGGKAFGGAGGNGGV